MAWFNTIWRRRAAITLDSAGATADYNVVIPKEWDDFWGVIDSAGANLRVVTYDGQTQLAFALDDGAGGAFDSTTRLGRLRLDAVAVPATAGMVLVWLYWYPTSNQLTAATSPTITSPRTGYIEISQPGQDAFEHRQQAPNLVRPRDILHKTADEQRSIWIRYDRVLQRRQTPANGAPIHEEPLYATQTVEDTSGADQAAMYDLTAARWVWCRGAMWLKVLLKAGTAGSNYTLVPLVRTVLPGSTAVAQVLETRIGVAVRDTRITS